MVLFLLQLLFSQATSQLPKQGGGKRKKKGRLGKKSMDTRTSASRVNTKELRFQSACKCPFLGLLSAHSVSLVAVLLSLFLEFINPLSFFSPSGRKLGGGEIFLVSGRPLQWMQFLCGFVTALFIWGILSTQKSACD